MLGFASPWPPSPTLLITSRRGGMRWSRVGCLSLGIDSPPFYGPPLCPIRPILETPHYAHRVSCVLEGAQGHPFEGTVGV